MAPHSNHSGKLLGTMALIAVFFSAAEVALSQPMSWRDIEDAGSEHLMTVTAPPGYSAEQVLQTILENPKLPARLRAHFVRIAQAKAPHLLDRAERLALKTAQ